MDITYSFGEWLRRRRKTQDLTQRELAERAYCSINTIKKIEADQRRPSRELAQMLANALALPDKKLAVFIECARGLRPVDHLTKEPGYRGDTAPLPAITPSPLPVAATPLIGRETEMEMLNHLLAKSWLITIVGPGGMGKTRLALAAATAYQHTGQATAFVSLAELNEAANLATAVAKALGLQLKADSNPTQQLLAYLRQKTLLLVLDNFEHLLDGAVLLTQMRQTAPGVTILVTSREQLQIPGEQLLPLQGLHYPHDQLELSATAVTDHMPQYPALQLFLDNARRLLPDFAPDDISALLRLCQITEGMPLALELAAAWIDTLSLSELMLELTHNLDILTQKHPHRPIRHHSIRAVFDTTWQHLGPAEQEIFARLAVFRGGFTRSTAEAVVEITLPVLSELVGRHLVQLDHGNGRYTLHELMRQYGLEKLDTLGKLTTIRQRHFAFYLELAETANAHLRGPEQAHWLDRLDDEQDNFRTALTWSLSQSIMDAANLALALSWYWRIRNHVIEARQQLTEVLAEDVGDTAVNATLNFHAGHMAWMQGDYPTARQHQETSQALWQSLGAAGIQGLAYTRHALGMVAAQEINYPEAQQHFTTSLLLFEQSQDHWGVAFAQQWLGATTIKMGDLEEAQTLLQKSLVAVRQIGDRWATGLVLTWLSWLEWKCENWEQAYTLADEASHIAEAMRHWHSLGATLQMLAQIAHKRGDLATARQLYQKSVKLYTDMGNETLAAELQAQLDELHL